ncbi:MAG: hypothetical protein ACOYON_10225 [Fimbriimonas sp.]
MAPLLALALLAVPQLPDDPPRLRTILPNGAVILVERMPKAKTISASLWISSRGTEESAETHGLRHMAEHLMAARPGIDAKLESKGSILLAQTLRDGMQFEVRGPSSEPIDLALETLFAVASPMKVDAERIIVEAKTLVQELALAEGPSLFARAAWSASYGAQGLDPLGNSTAFGQATPARLGNLVSRMLVGSNLVVVVAGPVSIDDTIAKIRPWLSAFPKSAPAPFSARKANSAGDAEVEASGAAVGRAVDAYNDESTLAIFAGALACASEVSNSFVTYTPSIRPGLVTAGQTDGSELTGKLGAASQASFAYTFGKPLAKRWVNRFLQSPSGVTYLRGLLLCQSSDATPEAMLSGIDSLNYRTFEPAWRSWTSPDAVRLNGVFK